MLKPLPLIELETIKREPYPLDCLPKLMSEATEAITEYVKCAPEIAAFNVIGAVTHLAQSRVDVETRLGRMPTSLLTLALGESGEGKTASRNIAFYPIEKLEKERSQKYAKELEDWQAEQELLNGKELKSFLASNPLPTDPKTTFDSGNASLPRIMSLFANGLSYASWRSDEGSAFFSSYNMSKENKSVSLGALINLNDSGGGERLVSSSNLDTGGRFYNRRLSLMLLAQPEVIQKYLADPINRQQGFLPRTLFTAPPSTAHTAFMEVEDSGKRPHQDPRVLNYWGRIEALQKLDVCLDEYNGVITKALKFAKDADELFAVNHNNLVKELEPRTGELEVIKAFALRNNEIAARLAGVFAFMEGKELISTDNFTKAAYLARHSLNEWLAQTYSAPVKAQTSITYKAIHFILTKFLEDVAANSEKPSKWLFFTPRTVKQYGLGTYRSLPTSKHRAYLNELVAAGYLQVAGEGNKNYSLSRWFTLHKELQGLTPATTATVATKLLETLQHVD